MTIDEYLSLIRIALETACWAAGPILLCTLCVGFVTGVLQAATQIHDSSVSFIPKVIGVVAVLVLFGHFMLERLSTLTVMIIERIGTI